MGAASQFEAACQLATDGLLLEARDEFQALLAEDAAASPVVLNNLAAVEAALGNTTSACELLSNTAFESARLDAAKENREFLKVRAAFDSDDPSNRSRRPARRKIAIVSLLFNWPSTGGGTVHTKELADFLSRAGYEVCHFYAVNDEWRVGKVQEILPYPSHPLVFDSRSWNQDVIRQRFREAVSGFAPEAVIVTDSWNTKVLLAEAVAESPYFLRIAALECLCPLNNVRLLVDINRQPQQCELTQLANPHDCKQCVQQNLHLSGSLHQAERQLAGFFADDYSTRLRQVFANAEGVLAVNPKIAELVKPDTKAVHVVPSGFDEQRFPVELTASPPDRQRKRILFAGLTNEFMKGFHVLRQAAELLWQQRQDFEIIATGEPVEPTNDNTRYVGWQSQEKLPQLIADCDFLVFPTIAQEALGRTAVEAMACGRPVVASDLGGLSWVVEHEITGLLCRPGDPEDLAAKCSQLLDDAELRKQLGNNGRTKFEQQFTWKHIIQNHYLEILGRPVSVAQDLASEG